MKQSVTFITGNQGKADFLAKTLGIPIAHHKLDLTEVQSLNLHEVVTHKAHEAYSILKTPVLVEDASLAFVAMGRLPGTFIKWFIEELGYDGLARMASTLPSQIAHGKVCYGLYDGRLLHLFDGEMHGKIAPQPVDGPMGFGFDTIFINDGFDVPRSQMSEADHIRSSYRTMALNELRKFLTGVAA